MAGNSVLIADFIYQLLTIPTTMEIGYAEGKVTTSVHEAYTRIVFLRNVTVATVKAFHVQNPSSNAFRAFEAEIHLLHASMVALLKTTNVRPEVIVDTGLRITEEAWDVPPSSVLFALERFLHVLCAVEAWLLLKMRISLSCVIKTCLLDSLRACSTIFSLFSKGLKGNSMGQNRSNEGDDFEELDPLADVVGVTQEQINSLPILFAADIGEEQCNICLQSIVDGH